MAEAVKDLSNAASADHLEDDVNVILTVALHTNVLNDVRVLQILEQIDLVFNGIQLLLSFLRVGPPAEFYGFDGQKTASSEIQSGVDFSDCPLPNQIVLLVMNF